MAHKYNGVVRICLWSSPRNISTALMYSFAQRADTYAFDEPHYGHYLRVVNAQHPGEQEVMAAMDCNGDRVTRNVILAPYDRPIVFFKNMTHHLVDLNLDFLEHTVNILLTRNPVEMLPSLQKGLGRLPILRDTGFGGQLDLLERLKSLGQNPPILESRELLLDPPGVLRQLCAHIDIPFDEAMLSWPPGPKPEDGVWAKYWYHNLHKSTGFQPYRPKTEPFPDELRPLLAECQPVYEQLLPHVIRAGK
ncbi:MAG: sulfotransferase family protein [Chloroflexi bacterium]|nr:MAG: sulfotransferase family protein [Chloroflexota bacterium]